jgi:hypothetical protein
MQDRGCGLPRIHLLLSTSVNIPYGPYTGASPSGIMLAVSYGSSGKGGSGKEETNVGSRE